MIANMLALLSRIDIHCRWASRFENTRRTHGLGFLGRKRRLLHSRQTAVGRNPVCILGDCSLTPSPNIFFINFKKARRLTPGFVGLSAKISAKQRRTGTRNSWARLRDLSPTEPASSARLGRDCEPQGRKRRGPGKKEVLVAPPHMKSGRPPRTALWTGTRKHLPATDGCFRALYKRARAM